MRKFAIAAVFISVLFGGVYNLVELYINYHKTATRIIQVDERPEELQVAEIFGRSVGCGNASPSLIEEVTRAATVSNVSPSLVASVVAQESQCYRYAISSRGAVGLMQIHVSAWKNQYDFGGKDNLFNVKDNLRVGSEILSTLVKKYGAEKGVELYQGAGQGCSTCDSDYKQEVFSKLKLRKGTHAANQ